MPIKSEVEHLKLPRELDRRIKLTNDDILEIKFLINTTELSNEKIGKKYGVHRKTIYNIRNPEKVILEKARYKIRRLDGRYYDKEKHTKAMENTRKHRKTANLIPRKI